MGATGTTQVPHAVNNFYSDVLLERAVPLFLHARFAQIKDIPQGNTGTIKFRKYGALTAATTPLSEGITPPGSALSVTDITATIKYYGDYVTITDVLQYESPDPVLTEASEVLGEQTGDTLDILVRDVIVAGTTVQYASTATSRVTVAAAMKIDATEIKEAVRTLQEANAKPITRIVDPGPGYNTSPISAAFIGLIHPKTLFDLKSATGFIKVANYANKKDVMVGEVGMLDEVRFLMTTNAKLFAGLGAAGIDVYATMIIAKNAYAISRLSGMALRSITMPLGSAGTADPLKQRATQGWKASLATARLEETYMLRLEHAVS